MTIGKILVLANKNAELQLRVFLSHSNAGSDLPTWIISYGAADLGFQPVVDGSRIANFSPFSKNSQRTLVLQV